MILINMKLILVAWKVVALLDDRALQKDYL